MANGGEKSSDFYAVLGLNKECTPTELRTAYKKLALRWHPDRCSASGNSKFVEEAKKRFQAIQQAYSVLSDANKRFLYDVGAYDSDDDENGMGDFLNEMAVMMSQTKSSENAEESFEELQQLFEEMFQVDIDSFGSNGQPTTSCSSSPFGESSGSNKRNSADMSSMQESSNSSFDAQFHGFCLGVEDIRQRRGAKAKGGGVTADGADASRRRNGRKQKVSSGHDVSSYDYGISGS
ncbi:hypothetical protein V6N13_015754 [Hibiscus sabdariffa]|uniref:J domain-containing protein n=1 Tax=Hibiscus sabdariffa TaxID=183260 RepID=A0ABR2CX46_9ROSI